MRKLLSLIFVGAGIACLIVKNFLELAENVSTIITVVAIVFIVAGVILSALANIAGMKELYISSKKSNTADEDVLALHAEDSVGATVIYGVHKSKYPELEIALLSNHGSLQIYFDTATNEYIMLVRNPYRPMEERAFFKMIASKNKTVVRKGLRTIDVTSYNENELVKFIADIFNK